MCPLSSDAGGAGEGKLPRGPLGECPSRGGGTGQNGVQLRHAAAGWGATGTTNY